MKSFAYVIGDPVEQSRSPELFKKFFKVSKAINCDYIKKLVHESELEEFCMEVRKNDNCKGFNVTIPHKNAIVTYVDKIDKMAAEIGAVNAVANIDGVLVGFNTDYIGIKESIQGKVAIKNKAVIIGAGGASKAAIAAVKDIGFNKVIIINRTPEKAATLAEKFDVESAVFANLDKEIVDADLIINSSSSSFVDLDLSHCKETVVIVDFTYYLEGKNMAYNASNLGYKVIQGLEILVRQAIPCAKLWFDVDIAYTDQLLDF